MLPKRNLSEDSVSLEIDLEKMFGKKITDPALRRNIAESFIDIILKRTSNGQGVNGNGQVVTFPKYSKTYIESDEFKAFDKSPGEINLKLTGSMLASVDLLADRADAIAIGIDNEDAPKAYNHIVGDTVKKRPFLGLTSNDIEKVKQEYSEQVGSDKIVSVADVFEMRDLARLANIVGARGKTKVTP
jgi:hypothetical protein